MIQCAGKPHPPRHQPCAANAVLTGRVACTEWSRRIAPAASPRSWRATVLLLLSHVSMGRRAISDGYAAVDTKIYLLVDYVYDGYVMMNYCTRAATCAAKQHSTALSFAHNAQLCLSVLLCCMSVAFRRPSCRSCLCSCASGAQKAEEGCGSHQ